MKLFQTCSLLLIFLSVTTSQQVLKYAKLGCNDTCGNVMIPYPFGIGSTCAVNNWYVVECNSSTPYLSTLNHLQIINIDLRNQTITVNTPTVTSTLGCQNAHQDIKSVDLGDSPFWFSSSQNKLVLQGCGNVAILDNGNVISGCSTSCGNDTNTNEKNGCFGINCCQTTIPYYLKSFDVKLTGEDERSCGSAFLVDENSYLDEGRIGNVSEVVPVTLFWTLSEIDFNEISCCVTEDCAKCRNEGGFCEYSFPTYVNLNCTYYTNSGLLPEEGQSNKISLGIILGVSISMGVLCLVVLSYVFYKLIKRIKENRRRKRFFKRNSGLLLKQQQEADSSLVNKTILFTSRDLQKATDNFNENRILGRGGQGTVYRGMLVDGRIVAVKKSKVVDESQLEQFINEVVILSQVNHRNVVKLLGCCLETDVPLLVSEFISNGTLYDCLHNNNDEYPLSLNMRLQKATEVAGALGYLHSSTSIPIYHRDIKTSNILLDDKNRAKIADFGTSRFVSLEQTHLTTIVKGTFGYLDPAYFLSSQFTEKSDVYSFGVVLVELLTRERPISLTRFGEHRNLATYFMLAMEEERVMSIFDATIVNEGSRDELLAIAHIALRCLNMNGRNRPTMKEVAMELENLRTSHIPSTVQTNIIPSVYEDGFSMVTYDDTTSTFLSLDNNISQ
ncbi:wall-associated receptor kinase-like 1 [Rutidosis leptorrhynchoides]|uniref:wall-associated receptor kinase-like 1 n=1 Tax=Rutidosis leptorrhynchoides TaxID=125765 RepID=UPI003A9A07D2